MSEWLTYDPRDFLLFSQTTYWRLFERVNDSYWPFQIVVCLLIAGLLAGAFVWRHASNLLFGLLCLGWAAVAMTFLPVYAEINWAVAYVVPGFWLQAACLGLVACFGMGSCIREPEELRDLRGLAGVGIVVIALIVWPSLALIFRQSVGSAEVFGFAPDPTALVTLGILIVFGRRWPVVLLGLAPVIWCLISASTLFTMGALAEGWMLLAVIIATLASVSFARQFSSVY
jgi:hypothetical protein